MHVFRSVDYDRRLPFNIPLLLHQVLRVPPNLGTIPTGAYLLYGDLDVQASLRHSDFFKGADARQTVTPASVMLEVGWRGGAILRQFTLDPRDCRHTSLESGFHPSINDPHPETVSPKLRGELPST